MNTDSLYIRKQLAMEAIKPYQQQLRDGGLIDMTDAEFETWKAEIWPVWIAAISAQRDYQRAKAGVTS